jgi:hypothetical protein
LNLKYPLLRVLNIYECLFKTGAIKAADAHEWIASVLQAIKSRSVESGRRKKTENIFMDHHLHAIAKLILEMWAGPFISQKAPGDDTQALMKAVDELVGRVNLSSAILDYVTVNFQRGGAGAKNYCGYLVNSVLKKFYDEAVGNPDAPRLTTNTFMKKNPEFSENLLLKPIFNPQGRLDIGTDEFLQILSLTSLSDYLDLAHSTAFSDNDKLHHFFVGSSFDSLAPGLKLEVAKMMKLPGSNPKYLKAMCAFFNLDPQSLNSKPVPEMVNELIKIGDLDFDQLVSGMWSQMSENGRLP